MKLYIHYVDTNGGAWTFKPPLAVTLVLLKLYVAPVYSSKCDVKGRAC